MGSRGPVSKRTTEVRFALGVPKPSSRLSELARGEYVRAVELCREAGRELQQPDMAVLESYASSWAEAWDLDKRVGADHVLDAPNGYKYANPLVSLREQAWKRCMAAAAKLGFSPSDRNRIGSKGTGKSKADPIDSFV